MSQCHLCEVEATSETLGKAVGLKRALSIGIKNECEIEGVSGGMHLFAFFIVFVLGLNRLIGLCFVPVLPFVENAQAPKYEDLKTMLTETAARKEIIDRRDKRKQIFHQKQEELKKRVRQKMNEEKEQKKKNQETQREHKKNRNDNRNNKNRKNYNRGNSNNNLNRN